MSDQKERSVEGVLQEMQRVGEAVDIARRVVVVGGGHRASLAGMLGKMLEKHGLKVQLADPGMINPLAPVPEEAPGGLYKSFADVLACPSLAHLFGTPAAHEDSQPQPRSVVDELAHIFSDMYGNAESPGPSNTLATPLEEPAPAAESDPLMSAPELSADLPAVPGIPYRAALMAYPETWEPGDLFEDHPRYSLPHKVRKWLLESFDAENVTLRSPNCSSSDLISLEIFQKRYVFHSRPESADE